MTTPTPIEPKPDLKKVPELTLHSLCEIIPPCKETEFKELKEDIKANGLQVPIKTFEAKILDGRSRHKACVELEQEGHPVEFKRETFLGSAKEALAYVISMNVKRRHLSASLRALIVARLVTSKLGGDRSVKLPTEITQEDVARLAGVAVKTVTDAKKVLSRPDLVEKVLGGELAVAKAADQIRDEEEKSGTQEQTQPETVREKVKIEYQKASDTKTALNVCNILTQHLLDALEDLSKLSSFGHAEVYAGQIEEAIDRKIAQMQPQPEEEETEKELA